MTEFLFSSSQQNQPQKSAFAEKIWIFPLDFEKLSTKKGMFLFVFWIFRNFGNYCGDNVEYDVLYDATWKVIKYDEIFLGFFFLNFFFLRSWIFFFNLDFFNLLVCRGKKANFSFFWLFWLLFGQLWDDSY